MTAENMKAYREHSRRDARSMVELLDKKVGLTQARDIFHKYTPEQLAAFEQKNLALIAEFLGKTDAHRGMFLRKIAQEADERTLAVFLIMCILTALRINRFLAIRDEHLDYLTPGKAYRVTAEGLAGFLNEARSIYVYQWPKQLLNQMGYMLEYAVEPREVAPISPMDTDPGEPVP